MRTFIGLNNNIAISWFTVAILFHTSIARYRYLPRVKSDLAGSTSPIQFYRQFCRQYRVPGWYPVLHDSEKPNHNAKQLVIYCYRTSYTEFLKRKSSLSGILWQVGDQLLLNLVMHSMKYVNKYLRPKRNHGVSISFVNLQMSHINLTK